LKILIAIPCLLSGGTEIQTINLTKVLRSFGLRVNVLCYFEYDDRIVQKFRETGCLVKLLGLNRRIFFISFLKTLKKEIRCIKPDIAHIQYMAPGALPIIASRLARVKIVLTTVHQPYTKSHGRLAKLILRATSKLTDRFISVSRNTEHSWFGTSIIFDEKKKLNIQPHHFTIHNAIDTDKIRSIINNIDQNSIKEILNIPDDRVIIGTVSRLRYEKGIDTLIEAFLQLTQLQSNIHLLIVGGGPDEEMLQKRVRESGISSQVTFLGTVDWERAIELMSIMDIVVVPSRFEGFGLSAAEAMAAGKPVIASNTSGLKEVVSNNETGIFVPVDNSNALKNAMMKLISDPQLRNKLGNAGKTRVNENFSMEIFTKKIHALYNGIS